MIQLPAKEEIPQWLSYPGALLRVADLGLANLHPWLIMSRDQVLARLEGLRKRYPGRELVPFARRLDCDDLACFERSSPGTVVVIHDFASSGWENRKNFSSFEDWFRSAIDDMLTFEP